MGHYEGVLDDVLLSSSVTLKKIISPDAYFPKVFISFSQAIIRSISFCLISIQYVWKTCICDDSRMKSDDFEDLDTCSKLF